MLYCEIDLVKIECENEGKYFASAAFVVIIGLEYTTSWLHSCIKFLLSDSSC